MVEGRIAELPRRSVVAVGGPEARPFLNDLITTDIEHLATGGAVYGGLLTPQGKVLFDFIVFFDGRRFLFDLPRAARADFVKRLTFYRLRAKVEISNLEERHRVFVAWGGDARRPSTGSSPPTRACRRSAIARSWRATRHRPATRRPTKPITALTASRLACRKAVIDFAFGDAFPHDADMDQLGGVDFKKGCFVGQEVVSRMEHRGTARRRFVIARGDSSLPAPGTEILAGERPVGTLASSVEGTGLALVRLDRAKEAIDAGTPLAAGETPVSLALPDWAKFGWPAAASED